MSGAEEVVVSQAQGITFKVTKAAEMLEKNGTVTITGINTAISNAVALVELLKHRVKGLHQVNTFERVPDSFKTRVVFKLSYKTEETTGSGYQKPIPENEVQEKTLTELKKPPWGDRNVDSKLESGETRTGDNVERRGRWGGRRSRFRARRGRYDNNREGTDRDAVVHGGEDESGNVERSSWVRRSRRGDRGGRGGYRGDRGSRWVDRGDRGGRRGYYGGYRNDRGGDRDLNNEEGENRGGRRGYYGGYRNDRGGDRDFNNEERENRGGRRGNRRGYRNNRDGDRDWNNEDRENRGETSGYRRGNYENRRPRGDRGGRRGGYGYEDRGNRGESRGNTRGGSN